MIVLSDGGYVVAIKMLLSANTGTAIPRKRRTCPQEPATITVCLRGTSQHLHPFVCQIEANG
jgi:hypothetical protein